MATDLPTSVLIREVGPREGFQILPTVYPTSEKLRLIQALAAAGLSQIEVTSFVRSDRLPQMADAEELVAQLPLQSAAEFTALYLNRKGFERAESTGRLSNQGWLYTAVSDTFLQRNNNSSLDAGVAAVPEWIAAFRAAGKRVHGLMVSTAFGCHFEGRITSSMVVSVVSRFLDACKQHGESPQEICLADTIGVAHPNAIRAAVQAVRSLGVTVSLHLHDTWGLGLVNVYAGLREGVSVFESSIAGLGGCPFTPGAAGNVATEEIVYLCHSLGIRTGIDVDAACKAALLAHEVTGSSVTSKFLQGFALTGKVERG